MVDGEASPIFVLHL